MNGKKRYEVLLDFLNQNPSPKAWALVRILIDCMTPEELYEEIPWQERDDLSYKEMESKDLLNLLKIPTERVTKLKIGEEARTLKNYDVPLVNAVSGRKNKAKELINYLRDIGLKKKLNEADFEHYKEIMDEFDNLKRNLKEAFKKFPEKGVTFWREYWNDIWSGEEKGKE